MTAFFGNGSGDLRADKRYTLALRYAEDKDYAAAADLLSEALEISPSWPPILFHLGECLRLDGRDGEAKTAFNAYLSLDAEDCMGANIKLALIDRTSPGTMPPAYIQSLFDQYAPRFEKSLVQDLDYHIPETLYDLVTACGATFNFILDLGCGTGLAAAPFTKSEIGIPHIHGVDLSNAMLSIAKDKNIYELLHTSSIESYLASCITSYDLILAADVFIYIGALDRLFCDIARHLLKDGLFAFSVQIQSGDDWILGNDHRYAHAPAYLERCLQAAGLNITHQEETIIRMDRGSPVAGMVFVCQKPV